jgi:hypothetical protein
MKILIVFLICIGLVAAHSERYEESYLAELIESLVNINNSIVGINKTVNKLQLFLEELESNFISNLTVISDKGLRMGNQVINETFPLVDLVKQNFPSFLKTLNSVDTVSDKTKDVNVANIALISLLVATIFFSVGSGCFLVFGICGGVVIYEYARRRNKSLSINSYDIMQE